MDRSTAAELKGSNDLCSRSMARNRLRRAALHATLGLAVGYVVLHPISMLIVRALDAPLGHDAGALAIPDLRSALLESFAPHMIPMSLLFALLCGMFGGVDGYSRATVVAQRDRLARELAVNRRHRRELAIRSQALRRLDRANRRTTRFIVHEFKNHLGCIIGFTELIRGKAQESWGVGVIEALERIHRQAHRMKAGVEDLLNLARLQKSPRLSLRLTRVATLLADVAADLTVPAERGSLTIGPRHETCPEVVMDATMIGRVLTNLAGNAFKHNPAGTEVAIDAELRHESEVLFWCRDRGRGIPEEDLPTLFGEFATGASADPRSSTGIGLAFCKAAVVAHGGRIWCETSPQGGATFFFTVPVRSDPDPRQGGGTCRSAAGTVPALHPAGERPAT
ncbi:MAG: HAMP domain-containing sensor histidine kinase [Planctomycetota bacterium]